ncbi:MULTISPECIES: helix-turn-helix transcriptional regulator [unclassified Pseudoxanthomonas]|uniref:helix-turn-helix domain-containing protein n=1 Tax=unclassified Pseudoxanthomonas TaxID=2645906 RepID=UPI003076D1F4
MDFGTYIAELREKKDLSLRQLEEKAGDLSHVYIWRLEKGDRIAPSPETLEKLTTALGATSREREIASLLVKTKIEDSLYQLIVKRPDIPIEDFEPVATMSFRGSRPTTPEAWLQLINMVKSLKP